MKGFVVRPAALMARVHLPSTRAFYDVVMMEYRQQVSYTIDEIRAKFATRLVPDWDSPPHGPFMGESVTWAQWQEAFPLPERDDFLLGGGLETEPSSCLDTDSEYDPTVWTPYLFDAHTLPAAAYLDPEGWTQIMKLGSRNSKHWRSFCPNTYSVASVLFDGLIQRDLWGQHLGKGKWKTLTAGKKPEGKTPEGKKPEEFAEATTGDSGAGGLRRAGDWVKRKRDWPDKSMKLIDVLNALGNPDRYALGSTDARLKIYEREDIWRHPFYETKVNRLQIDVDMNRAWGQYIISNPDQDEVAEELRRESALVQGLGLTPHFFRTGGRGHQLVIPVPTLDRSVASVLVLMIRYLLAEGRTAKKKPRYKVLEVDKSNLDCLMRLPLGRHAETKSVAWMIDPNTATTLPPDQQAQAVALAWTYGGNGCEPLEQSREALGLALDGMYYDRDLSVYSATADADRFQALAEIVAGLPDCTILDAFHSACDAWRVPSLRRSLADAAPCVPLQPYYICGAVSSEGDSETERDVEKARSVMPGAAPVGGNSISVPPPRIQLGKGWASQVITDGFEAGRFHAWARADGCNGIGAAILLCDGGLDRAEELLIAMADSVECRSEAERESRRRYIRWAVPKNNIDIHYERSALSQHRHLEGLVMESETERAAQVIGELVRRRRESELRRKLFDPKALTTLRHIVELVQMEARKSKDEFVRVSARTLAAEIAARWPEDATDGKDVSRQMKWITRKLPGRARRVAVAPTAASKKNECLFCVLELMPTSRRAFDAKGYVLGNDFEVMLPVGK